MYLVCQKKKAAKIDIPSHCTIPLLHHTYPKKPIPHTIKPGQTMDLWSNSEINAVQQSVERTQK